MFAVIASDKPEATSSDEVSEFMVAPPRSPAYAGRDWEQPLGTYLRREFPGLTFHVSRDMPFRNATETAVVPILGKVGTGWEGSGTMKRMTDKTQKTMDRIAAAVDDFDPENPLFFTH